jgi:hypothetical protein
MKPFTVFGRFLKERLLFYRLLPLTKAFRG